MSAVFSSFATDDFRDRMERLCESAAAVGFDTIKRYSMSDLKGSSFAERNSAILSLERGAGYWLWKPWVIYDCLKELSQNDVLLYCDAGRDSYHVLKTFPKQLIDFVKNSDKGFLLGPTIPQYGPISKWTKRDCLKLLDMDRPDIISLPPIQATWSFWSPTRTAQQFLTDWMAYCEDARCLTDCPNELGDPNYPDFIDHRHDQAILTLLAYKSQAPYLDFSDTRLAQILALRPQSSLSTLFLRRVDDAEGLYGGQLYRSLFRSFFAIRKLVQ